MSPPAPVYNMAEDSTEIAPRRWNWGALFLGPWWALAQRAYVAAAIYFVVDSALWILAVLLGLSGFNQSSSDYKALMLSMLGGVICVITAVLAIPLALLGDKIALKHRVFTDGDKFRAVQRIWGRCGAVVALAVVIPPIAGVVYQMITFPHTPNGLYSRLLAASAQGNTVEIKAVLEENRVKYGVGATNLDFDNAISNAKFNGNTEAIKLLQEAAAQQQRAAGSNQ